MAARHRAFLRLGGLERRRRRTPGWHHTTGLGSFEAGALSKALG